MGKEGWRATRIYDRIFDGGGRGEGQDRQSGEEDMEGRYEWG